MNFDSLREYCLKKKGAYEDFPFDSHTLVFKVGSKMFALTNVNGNPLSVNLKCDPELAEALREEYSSVRPGYHMNKRYWNTVMVNDVPEDKVKWMIDMSYNLVFNSLKRSERASILG